MFGLGRLGKLGSVGRALAAWTPAQLWPLGATSPGMWVDPPYTASLFSTSAGTTAISAIGTVLDTDNPVGLALDRKGGLALGPELVTNGGPGFTVTTGWVSAASTFSIESGRLRIVATGAGSAVYTSFTTVIGKTYKVVYSADKATQVGTSTLLNSASGLLMYTNVTGLDIDKSVFFTADATTTFFQLIGGSGAVGAYAELISASVREIPGIHLSQATATSRGVASARANLLSGTATLSTQNVTVAAIPHTITFSGGGTVAASGTFVGALTSGQTFTPTAGTLTLTVAGTVTSGMLNRGSDALTYQAVVSDSSYTAAGSPTFLKLDGSDDGWLSATFTANTAFTDGMDALIAVRRDSAANAVCGLYQSVAEANKVFGIAESGSGSGCVGSGAGTPTVLVDGTQLTGGTAVTRGTLHTALTPGDWHILEFRNLDLSTWTAVGFGLYTSYVLNGALGGIQLFASGQDANRDKARAAMAAYFGVTLP
jgi:hypothetical protein